MHSSSAKTVIDSSYTSFVCPKPFISIDYIISKRYSGYRDSPQEGYSSKFKEIIAIKPNIAHLINFNRTIFWKTFELILFTINFNILLYKFL